MAATTRFAAAISLLSAALIPAVSASPFDYPICKPTTTTVYTTVTVATGSSDSSSTPVKAVVSSINTPPASVSSISGVTWPTYSPEDPNPNGPFYNPHDYIPTTNAWPGLPTKGQTTVPPRPKPTSPYGGYHAEKYEAPAWHPKGSDLTPALPQSDTNGNSNWGLPDCPRLPYFDGEGSSLSSSRSAASKTTPSSALYKTSSSSAPSKISSSSDPFESLKSSGYYSSSKSNATATISSFSYKPTGYSHGSETASYSSYSSASYSHPPSNSTNGTMSSCGKMPNTGVTRKYTMDVSYQVIAPDGVTKNGLVVNGGFPGPLIEANWGDWIEVSVTNNLPDEGTSLHWHGLLQADTPWFDGVPAVSQCPIAPGQTKVYKFRADHYGTTWYHSHYSGQYAGGALGPIVIHGPKTAEYDEDIGPVILSDWYHKDYFSITQDTMAGRIPSSDNNLINGKMNYPCANTTFACTPNAGVSKFHFKAGKKYRLRLINTSAEGIQKFTIDGHTFTVIANDFIPINPYTTDVITLGVGQRSDVIVEAVGNDGDSFWMRANLGTFTTGCSLTTGVSPEGLAVVYYDSASPNTVPTTKSSLTAAALADCGNDPLETTTALCAVTPDPVPATTQQIDITFGSNGTNFIWFMNNQTYRGNYNHPVLQQVKQGNLTFEDEWNVYNMGTASSIRLVFKNFFAFGAHPMHLHGHDFHVLAEGFGDWDGTVVNPSNTQMRDVQLLRPGKRDGTPSYIVMQWTNDNSGVWPLHCHIAWHVSAGLYVNILERPDDIQKRHFPASSFETCAAWDAWTSSNVPNQIDSGL